MNEFRSLLYVICLSLALVGFHPRPVLARDVRLPGLSRWPVKHPPTQKVKVQVENSLACPGACVEHRPVTTSLEAPLPRQLRCDHEYPAEERSVVGSGVFQ